MIQTKLPTSMNNEKVIYNFIPIQRNLCITIQEIRDLLDFYPYGQRHRLCFAIMATAGLRVSEVVGITINSFLKEDLTEFVYRVSKFKKKKYSTGTTVINYKTRKAKIPLWLAKELKYYISRNYHCFEDGEIFPFSAESLRRYLNNLRELARDKKIPNKRLADALLEKTSESISFGCKSNDRYRISCHSFRRFYLTYIYHCVYDKDIALVQRDIGHDLTKTTYDYIYTEDNINVLPAVKDFNKTFFMLDTNTQVRINEFM